jgi:pimeloyl-ACP methyl ester carboxylesterase
LAARFRVTCPDNAGLGGSAQAEGVAVGGIEEMATDALALLDALGIERAAVVGWSMGGFIAQALAAAAPARVGSLALLSTDPGGPDCVAAAPEVQARLIDRSGTPREQASRLLALLFPPDLAASADANFGELVAAARAALPAAGLRAQEEAMRAWHARREPLPAIDPPIPTAIVHGALDQVIPLANAELLGRLHPGARVEVLPAAAHAPMAQDPGAVAEPIFAVTGVERRRRRARGQAATGSRRPARP